MPKSLPFFLPAEARTYTFLLLLLGSFLGGTLYGGPTQASELLCRQLFLSTQPRFQFPVGDRFQSLVFSDLKSIKSTELEGIPRFAYEMNRRVYSSTRSKDRLAIIKAMDNSIQPKAASLIAVIDKLENRVVAMMHFVRFNDHSGLPVFAWPAITDQAKRLMARPIAADSDAVDVFEIQKVAREGDSTKGIAFGLLMHSLARYLDSPNSTVRPQAFFHLHAADEDKTHFYGRSYSIPTTITPQVFSDQENATDTVHTISSDEIRQRTWLRPR